MCHQKKIALELRKGTECCAEKSWKRNFAQRNWRWNRKTGIYGNRFFADQCQNRKSLELHRNSENETKLESSNVSPKFTRTQKIGRKEFEIFFWLFKCKIENRCFSSDLATNGNGLWKNQNEISRKRPLVENKTSDFTRTWKQSVKKSKDATQQGV